MITGPSVPGTGSTRNQTNSAGTGGLDAAQRIAGVLLQPGAYRVRITTTLATRDPSTARPPAPDLLKLRRITLDELDERIVAGVPLGVPFELDRVDVDEKRPLLQVAPFTSNPSWDVVASIVATPIAR